MSAHFKQLPLDELRAFVNERADGALIIDDCDVAIIGVAERCGQPPLVCYDYALLVECFVTRDGMTHEEATEWVDVNIAGAWMGDGTPAILYRPET